MIGRRGLGGVAAGLAVAGCTPRVAALEAALAPSAAEAAAFYGVARGIAEVAALAEPALAPVVAAIVAVCDPLVAALSLGDNPARLAAEAQTLVLATAPAVHVVGNSEARRSAPGQAPIALVRREPAR